MKASEAMKRNREIMAIESAELISEVDVICSWNIEESRNMAPIPDIHWVLENCERSATGECLPVAYETCGICQVTSERCMHPGMED